MIHYTCSLSFRLVLVLSSLAISLAAMGQEVSLNTLEGLRPHNVLVEVSVHDGHTGVHVVDSGEFQGNNEDKLVILDELEFQDGVIEVSLAAAPGSHAGENARGFVGVAFRVAADMSSYDAFYLRPTNGRSDDQLRRNHSVQYISHPDYPWYRLRKETPGMYESYVDLVPDDWTQVRIEITDQQARLYVHGDEQPSLIVKDLKSGNDRGAIALWIGPGTDAYFRNMKVTSR